MKYFLCNFKNKLDYSEYNNYAKALEDFSCSFAKVVFFPSSPFLSLFKPHNYLLGSQDISSFSKQTITGEISGKALKSLNVSYVLVGHSERREYKNEINIDFINKINHAQENNLKVVYCIGETLEDQEKGRTYDVLEKQISEVLNNVEIKDIIIAYEPIWAIGTGNTPTKEQIKDVVEYIKDITEEKYDTTFPVLYGGSLNIDNFKEYAHIPNVDGFLVGGASSNLNNIKAMLLELMD